MTAVAENARRRGFVGDLKFIHVQSTAANATSDTLDLLSDATDGRGAEIQEILNTLLQDDAGADKTGTFDPATGIYTYGSISTGIHNLLVVGRKVI